jgi:hypothetical protein
VSFTTREPGVSTCISTNNCKRPSFTPRFFVVVGQAWRNGRVPVTLARFLRSEEVEIVPPDDQLARCSGELCGAARASDVIDASAVIVARERRDLIVTSDPDDIRRLDRAAQIVTL